ncbi:HyaD/HybD family hydrogenase maturation endopeptidase [Sulfurimonas microaerophilic]|uniref:HyaD/HybD family hydrogenase maturation endopeptidase n=1 Tax=Sulfurimonas microaerophilic TaxID=3058392 RepID=UPI00271474C0|nr:HyaD/HybD family hydrogenase maturation endopeptidase [Sulfurimonas sp. hsl 1-7]
MKELVVLGVGNILQHDDAIAVYASQYISDNYTFSPDIDIINGGVEGINLLNFFMEYKYILILDAIDIEDEAGAIYHIPSEELTGFGVNSGSAHDIGVLQCFELLELMGKKAPKSSVLGIVPHKIDTHIGLSETLHEKFEIYIQTLLNILSDLNITATKNDAEVFLDDVIEKFNNPRGLY